ncbi:MAG TPA: hypothetical protein DIU07_01115 [Rhodobacteraceae bacterium]|nr:hypothetical protein [Paracoccaceae bacterium]
MLYFSRMRWKIDGMSFDALWKLEGQEAKAAVDSIQKGIVSHLYKPCAEQYVISIGGARTVEDFDRYAMGILPMREHLIFEQVLPLEEGFTIDVFPYLTKRTAEMDDRPRLLHYVELHWDPRARSLDSHWAEIVETLQRLDAPKVLGVYRLAGREGAIAIIDIETAADLNHLAALPCLAGAEVTQVEALRDYLGFAEDVWRGYRFD